jgi:hypothetical protein
MKTTDCVSIHDRFFFFFFFSFRQFALSIAETRTLIFYHRSRRILKRISIADPSCCRQSKARDRRRPSRCRFSGYIKIEAIQVIVSSFREIFSLSPSLPFPNPFFVIIYILYIIPMTGVRFD